MSWQNWSGKLKQELRLEGEPVKVCEDGSHASFFGDQDAYFTALLQFLREVDRGTFPKGKG